MQIKLSDHFTYGRLLRYTLPTIVMIIFTSLYSVVDGLFVSNLVGDLALSAVNIAFPITMIIGAFGFMLGTGGSAIVARTLGEGKPELASRYFTLFIWCVAGLGVVLSIVTIAFIEPIMRFAGASDLPLEDCITLCSVCGDVRVTQLVNGIRGAHAVLPSRTWDFLQKKFGALTPEL